MLGVFALQGVLDQINESFESMGRRESLHFHLANVATLESCFGPLAAFFIDNRSALFVGADPRIASFILWHFVEEFEHRHSAIDIFDDVVGSHGFRLKTLPAVARQLAEVERIAREVFNDAAPLAPGGVGAGDVRAAFASIPRRRQLGLLWRLLATLLPWRRPERQPQPQWVSRWLTDHAAGADMTRYYPGS